MNKEHHQENTPDTTAASALIRSLPESLESFLQKWTRGMRQVGVLEHTTAKREDCILSFHGFMRPLLETLEQRKFDQDFSVLLKNEQNWAAFLLNQGRAHRARGINSWMFLMAFKPLVHALEEIIRESAAKPGVKLEALELLRRYADAYEVLVVREMMALSVPELQQKLDETNRLLTLEKCMLENVLASTSDLILVIDADGLITQANEAAKKLLKSSDLCGNFLGDLLNLKCTSMKVLLQRYPLNKIHEISIFKGSTCFQFQLIPLQNVSLAENGFLVLLTDITLLVQQRKKLQQQVEDQSIELANTEKQYQALFDAAGESILLLDLDMRVVQVNQRSSELFGCELERLIGRTGHELCDAESGTVLRQAVENLTHGQVWSDELTGRRCQGNFFPMAVTLNRVELDSAPLLQLLIRDITAQKALEERLVHEKTQLEEANIALRHVMKTIGQERQEIQQGLSLRIHSQLLPLLEKARNTDSETVRTGYLEVLQSQLDAVANEAGGAHHAGLLRLSPSEMKICQFIRSGASTKEMADTLNLSIETIQTHRKNIRKKLDLTRDVNLYRYLQEMPQTD